MRPDLYWIDNAYGHLAIGPRPKGEEWLADEVRGYRARGVDTLVSLLTADEAAELGLAREGVACDASNIALLNLPIEDRGIPDDGGPVHRFIHDLHRRLESGERVAIHCRAGIGRSAMVAASVLTLFGMDADEAFRRVAAARGCPVPDTDEQREWVVRFAARSGGHDRETRLPGI